VRMDDVVLICPECFIDMAEDFSGVHCCPRCRLIIKEKEV